MLLDEAGGGGEGLRIVAEGGEPVEERVAAEPGELALGVLAVTGLGLDDGRVAGE